MALITTDDKKLKKVLGQKQPAILVMVNGDDKNKPLLDALERESKKRGDELLAITVDVSENPDTHAKYDSPELPALVTMTPAFFGRNVKSTAEGIRPADVRNHIAHLMEDKPLPEEKPAQSKSNAIAKQGASHVTEKTFGKSVLKSKTPVLVDFWAAWCQPCISVAPYVDEMAQKYAGKVKVVKLNIDENRRLANQFRVQSIPTFIMFDGGQPVGRLNGANPRAIKDLIEENIIE